MGKTEDINKEKIKKNQDSDKEMENTIVSYVSSVQTEQEEENPENNVEQETAKDIAYWKGKALEYEEWATGNDDIKYEIKEVKARFERKEQEIWNHYNETCKEKEKEEEVTLGEATGKIEKLR